MKAEKNIKTSEKTWTKPTISSLAIEETLKFSVTNDGGGFS